MFQWSSFVRFRGGGVTKKDLKPGSSSLPPWKRFKYPKHRSPSLPKHHLAGKHLGWLTSDVLTRLLNTSSKKGGFSPPMWKIVAQVVKLDHFPPKFGMNIPKIFELPPPRPYNSCIYTKVFGGQHLDPPPFFLTLELPWLSRYSKTFSVGVGSCQVTTNTWSERHMVKRIESKLGSNNCGVASMVGWMQ